MNETPADHGAVTNEFLLETLKLIQGRLGELSKDMREIKRCIGILGAQNASLSNRIDRIDDRLARVERRLDLIDA